MKSYHLIIAVLVSLLTLSGCSPGPGELKGEWKLNSVMPATVIYRDGEEESMGIISPVSYRHEGNHVYVKYEAGLMEGHTVRFTRVNKDTYRSELGTLKRVK